MQRQIFNNQPSGSELRDIGIANAVAHADTETPKWSDIAYQFLCAWLSKMPSGRCFMAENWREDMEREGKLPLPPSLRAFGGIIVRAKHAGLIEYNGTAQVKNPKAHCANGAVWIVK